MASAQEVNEVEEAVRSIVPILAGKDRAIQGAILADLTSIWIIGHRSQNEAETSQLREEIIATHIKYVWHFAEVNEKLIDQVRKEMAN